MALHDFVIDLDCLEDLFEAFEVPFNESLVRQYRLHILKSFGLAVPAIERETQGQSAAAQKAQYAQALRLAHDSFVKQSPPANFWGSPRPELIAIRKKGA